MMNQKKLKTMKTFNSFLYESTKRKHINEFITFACDYLNIDALPLINIVDDKQYAKEQKSFGGYYPATQIIELNIAGRHTADVLRTLAHELVHHKQNIDGRLDETSGDTGSNIENEANAEAAIMMRNYGGAVPAIFEHVDLSK